MVSMEKQGIVFHAHFAHLSRACFALSVLLLLCKVCSLVSDALLVALDTLMRFVAWSDKLYSAFLSLWNTCWQHLHSFSFSGIYTRLTLWANMTAQSFWDWVNSSLLPSSHLQPHFPRSISVCTAIRWLHHLRFKPVSHKKGVYIDGHEREDVVRHRKSFLKTLGELRESHKPPPPSSDDPPQIKRDEDDEKKELVVIESIFNTNEGQTWMWGEEDRPAILPKTKGSGIMVSDLEGYLQLTDGEFEEAKQLFPNKTRQLLEY